MQLANHVRLARSLSVLVAVLVALCAARWLVATRVLTVAIGVIGGLALVRAYELRNEAGVLMRRNPPMP